MMALNPSPSRSRPRSMVIFRTSDIRTTGLFRSYGVYQTGEV